MRLGLLAMSGVRVIDPELAWLGVTLPQFLARGHVVASLPSLSLLTLAALTPDDVGVEYVEIPHIADLNTRRLPDFDAVAISSYSAQIGEAYVLADHLRARGTKVILGGPHVTALPQEALQHANAVVLGEAEPLWPRVIEDLGRGRLERIYRVAAGPLYDLRQSPVPQFHLLDPENYNRITIQTSRGCPHRCEFCAGSRLFGPGYRQKTVHQVLGEIRAVSEIWDRPFLEFADDNLFVDRRWGRELLQRLRPLGVRWFAETDISIADAPDLLQALRPAGCYQLLIGLESLSHDNLAAIESTGWKAGRLDRYVHAVHAIQDAGVTVNTCFIVGLDHDTPAVFDDIRRFVHEAQPLEIQVTVLTPFPGTPLFERLRHEGRLDEPPFWHKCTLFDVNYRPSGMSRDELRRGLYDLFRDLYNDEAFARRRRQYLDLIHKLRRRQDAAVPAG
ncbi:MAG: radical SAM protein [Thermoguttaceae bacterium]|jgi:radical SAM superfamily enzyme YgiQ (UPF0313 family)